MYERLGGCRFCILITLKMTVLEKQRTLVDMITVSVDSFGKLFTADLKTIYVLQLTLRCGYRPAAEH